MLHRLCIYLGASWESFLHSKSFCGSSLFLGNKGRNCYGTDIRFLKLLFKHSCNEATILINKRLLTVTVHAKRTYIKDTVSYCIGLFYDSNIRLQFLGIFGSVYFSKPDSSQVIFYAPNIPRNNNPIFESDIKHKKTFIYTI